MFKNEIYDLLGERNLSRTPCRIEMLKALLSAGTALSENELRARMDGNFDRTTIYRTLRNFQDQNLIHSIAIEGSDVRYAITHQREEHHEGHFHSHFFCDHCNNVYCLPWPGFNIPVLPEGFLARGYDLLINGKCNKCEVPD